jgi:ribosomal protein L35AE/L33A
MSKSTKSKVLHSNYVSYFEPGDISPHMGYTRQQLSIVKPIPRESVDEVEMVYPPEVWVARVAAACLEIIHGKRSLVQIRRISSHRVAQDLVIKQSVLAKKKEWGAISIQKVRFAPGTKGSAEVSINFVHDSKVYPMAMNFGQTKNGWRIDACEIGPH